MSISKIVLTGQALRAPEKRFTDDNLAICSFTMNFGYDNEEKVIRVLTFGKVAEKISETLQKGQTVIVEGKLQTNSVKTESGTEKKFFEINAQNVEIIGQQAAASSTQTEEKEAFSLADEISSDDLIGEDEIPF